MTEPSNVTNDDADQVTNDDADQHDDAEGDTASSTRNADETAVGIEVDQDKVDAWNDVKSDYEVEPDGEPVPNSMDEGGAEAAAP